jgi:hypothetical protein
VYADQYPATGNFFADGSARLIDSTHLVEKVRQILIWQILISFHVDFIHISAGNPSGK